MSIEIPVLDHHSSSAHEVAEDSGINFERMVRIRMFNGICLKHVNIGIRRCSCCGAQRIEEPLTTVVHARPFTS